VPAPSDVDVIVVTYNTRDLSVTSLRRLLDATTDVQLRLLVRDNASRDGTVDAIRVAVPEAILEAGAENLGFAGGVNRLLLQTTAPWVLLLNSDAWPEPGAIGQLISVGLDHPRAAAVAPQLLHPDGSREHSPLPFPSLGGSLASGLVPKRFIPARLGRQLLLPGAEPAAGRVDWAVGAALLLRRSALEDIGPLQERFFFYGEDLEWCWRAAHLGWEVRYQPAAVVRHIGNASAGSVYGSARGEVVWANTYAFLRASYPAPRRVAIRTVNAVGAALRAASARLQGRHDLAQHWVRELRAHVRPAKTSL
jgi:GT2 family glycosyltransferase